MKNVFKANGILLVSLSLLFISYFLPWYGIGRFENSSLFTVFIEGLKLVFINHFNPFTQGLGPEFGYWVAITEKIRLTFQICSILLPILIGITIYRIYKNKSYIIYKNIIILLTIAAIIIHTNFSLVYKYNKFINSITNAPSVSLKIGVLIALISVISLIAHSVIEKRLNGLIPYTLSKTSMFKQKWLRIGEQTSKLPTTTVENNIDANYCPSCGHKVGSNAHFCVNCGKELLDGFVPSSNSNKQSVKSINTKSLSNGFNHPVIKQFLIKVNNIVRKNPVVSILVAIVVTAFLVVSLVDSPEEAAQKAFKNNEENALEAAEKSVENQIEIDGFKFVKVKDMQATLTREENINTQQSGTFKVSGTAVLKDTEGKKHDDIPFQLYVDFYQDEYYAQQIVDIRYGYPLIEQLW
ncbi:zinc-ribbon domain-containing protein [Bacillus sp. MB2021]|uniref:zinc-ribbon domain-containing protein n=1 Tax=Bacillus sp. MB2021 TaxID=1408303 RepID=UPI0004E1D6B7|nr:zinc ribbon domain-containing protein [Bacillus sp. MB2021]